MLPFVFPRFSKCLKQLNILHSGISCLFLGHFKSLSQASEQAFWSNNPDNIHPSTLWDIYVDRAGQVSYSVFQMTHLALRAAR